MSRLFGKQTFIRSQYSHCSSPVKLVIELQTFHGRKIYRPFSNIKVGLNYLISKIKCASFSEYDYLELTCFHTYQGTVQVSEPSLNIYLFDELHHVGDEDSQSFLKYINPGPRKILFLSTKPSTRIF